MQGVTTITEGVTTITKGVTTITKGVTTIMERVTVPLMKVGTLPVSRGYSVPQTSPLVTGYQGVYNWEKLSGGVRSPKWALLGAIPNIY